jgi:CheY-like chemotaxis protein
VRAVTAKALRAAGYEVLVADGPVEAIALARQAAGTLRLLVTDVVMPTMGGRTLAEALTRAAPGLRVLFTSGYADKALSRDGVLEPGFDLLVKPYTAPTLLARVRAALDRGFPVD